MQIENPDAPMTPAVDLTQVHDAGEVRRVYERHPLVHPYGLADLTLFWNRSTWWCDREHVEAVVGVLDLPGSAIPVVYAVSATADEATRRVLARLARDGVLGSTFVVTGPRGMATTFTDSHRPRWARDHVKLACTRPDALAPRDERVRAVGPDDLAAVQRLFASDPAAGDFFHAGLLDDGWYRGIEAADGTLLSVAGTHVVDPVTGVAAIGNVATHPDARRRGLARATVATLTRELLSRGLRVGLNVAVDNPGARALYERLGFDWVADYEEAELVASDRSAQAPDRGSTVGG